MERSVYSPGLLGLLPQELFYIPPPPEEDAANAFRAKPPPSRQKKNIRSPEAEKRADYLKQFAALGLARRFVEVVWGEDVAELSYESGRVEFRWLGPGDARAAIQEWDKIKGDALETEFPPPMEAKFYLPGYRFGTSSEAVLPEMPASTLVDGLRNAISNVERTVNHPDTIDREFARHILRDLKHCRSNRFILHVWFR